MLSHPITKEQPQNSDVSYRSCPSLPFFVSWTPSYPPFLTKKYPVTRRSQIPPNDTMIHRRQRPRSPTPRGYSSSPTLKAKFTHPTVRTRNANSRLNFTFTKVR
ncbi:hypothetical protein M413DRAFT_32261 [Hebeloma cylindrosporum]|uniref:Uncharacterized protein n=1 Tax=Hebeloma cylindrosporum TaxID=76867 RepID=A0A0C2XD31_HEBCY|nr:hypothetical protein M413DRAFT_32261 [Hebeloma cylindrosporum h7]